MGGLEQILQRRKPNAFSQFIEEPCTYLATTLYNWRRIHLIEKPESSVSVVCISDTHNHQPSNIPPGDILIHAGDLTQGGTLQEIQASIDWLNSLLHPTKIVIGGNHDLRLDGNWTSFTAKTQPYPGEPALDWGNIIFLQSESTMVICKWGRHLKVYGSPYTPRHGNWAFQYPRQAGRNVWQGKVPEDIDILITHGPPKGHLDADNFGCQYLLDELWRIQPLLHVFGHIHAGHGIEWVRFDQLQRAYERTVNEGGGLWNLGRVLFQFAMEYFNPRPSRTTLVNAAIVEGIRDELKRRPITVLV